MQQHVEGHEPVQQARALHLASQHRGLLEAHFGGSTQLELVTTKKRALVVYEAAVGVHLDHAEPASRQVGDDVLSAVADRQQSALAHEQVFWPQPEDCAREGGAAGGIALDDVVEEAPRPRPAGTREPARRAGADEARAQSGNLARLRAAAQHATHCHRQLVGSHAGAVSAVHLQRTAVKAHDAALELGWAHEDALHVDARHHAPPD
mmetsp:Transcript_16471/g.41346  ORF Transcript_16471/g.41346 Transcript_16471/m.41346 type:complete len:207 (-) Transcript_16471:809-1429(-)